MKQLTGMSELQRAFGVDFRELLMGPAPRKQKVWSGARFFVEVRNAERQNVEI
jgi:N-acyl-L-homoserine lactone synthetase